MSSITYYSFIALVALLLNPVSPAITTHIQPKNNTTCQNWCGSVKIDYPFGIGPGCSHNANFNVICKPSSPHPKPFLTSLNLEILDIQSDPEPYGFEGTVRVKSPIIKVCSPANSKTPNETTWDGLNLTDYSPFRYDYSTIALVSIGCGGKATVYNESGGTMGGCISTCDGVMDGCSGYRCCQSLIDRSSNFDTLSLRVIAMPGKCRVAFFSFYNFMNVTDAVARNAFNQSLIVPLDFFYFQDKRNYIMILKEIMATAGIILGIVAVTSALSCCCFGSYWFCKTNKSRREIKLRAKYFKGKVKQSSNEKEVIKKTKLFTIKELKKITDNFNKNRVLGEGGQGTVYKGMLKNGPVIAVKRSKTFEEKELEQFTNEVILLSQVNHKNVVKLLGCCLETKLPLLVYEFVPNGTLWQHINNPNDKSLLTWEMRVKIAAQSAGAIDYLHTSSSTPIYHRDIKSTNILLDENFQAKVADFGISKAIVADQTHLTTCVQGTFGYVDPEYYRSSRFSEKSDVYSFGVILVELLTGQQPVRVTELEEERSLVLYFITFMNETNLEEILDPIVLEAGTKKEIMTVANLAKQCLKPRGIQRPTMKEVAMELESLRKNYAKKDITLQNLSSMEIEDSEFGSTFEMGNDNNASTCPIMHNMVSITHDNDDNEQPSLVQTW